VIDNIKSQLETKTSSGEYLEKFNIYDHDEIDAEVMTELPYCAIVMGPPKDDGSVGGTRSRRTILSFAFRIAFRAGYEDEIQSSLKGDFLLYSIVRAHKLFLQDMVFDPTTISVYERGLVDAMEVGYATTEEGEVDDDGIIHAAMMVWPLTILDRVL